MPTTKQLIVFPVWLLALLTGCSVIPHTDASKTDHIAENIAAQLGWLTNYARGREIIHELSSLTPEQRQELKIGAYREDKVAFVGFTAPPGGEDLMMEGGYLRLRYPDGKQPPKRPYIWHEIMVGEGFYRCFRRGRSSFSGP
jgi:hypothetical protein